MQKERGEESEKERRSRTSLWYRCGMRESARPLHEFLVRPRGPKQSFQLEPAHRVQRDLCNIPSYNLRFRDNKQSCYKREINISSFAAYPRSDRTREQPHDRFLLRCILTRYLRTVRNSSASVRGRAICPRTRSC